MADEVKNGRLFLLQAPQQARYARVGEFICLKTTLRAAKRAYDRCCLLFREVELRVFL